MQPEVIWDSNRVSQPLDFTKSFPSQPNVQVIVGNGYMEEFRKQIPSEYAIESIKAYDRNYFSSAEDNKHRGRKVTYLYTLKRKN
jgi:hypothetical protein